MKLFERCTRTGGLKRATVLATAVTLVGLMSGVLLAGQAAAPAKPLLAGEAFKNVPALKNLPVDDFMATMGIMSAALAFDCSDCHKGAGTEKVDWAFDTPRKITARRMVNMVTTINRDQFRGRQVVTCWTCHRGRDRPVVTPTLDYVYGTPTVEQDDLFFVSTPGMPSADSILDKYVEAMGGAQKLSEVTSFVATGKSVFYGGFGGAGQVRIFAKAPDRRTTIIEFKDAPGRGDSTRTFDGTTGWMKTPMSVLGEYRLSGAESDGARLDALMSFPGQIKRNFTKLRVGPPSTVHNKPVNVIQGEGPRGLVATLFFDRQSGLLLRYIRYSASPIGRMPTQVDYDDYRDVGGIKMPFKWTFAWLDGRDEIELTDVQKNVSIDDARFGRPSGALAK